MKLVHLCCRYLKRIIQIIHLIGITMTNKNIKLIDKVWQYGIATDTELNASDCGNIKFGFISTMTNVHLVAVGGNLEIGHHCGFNRNDIVICRHSVKIGDGTTMGPNVCIYDHDHVFGEDGMVSGFNCSPIVIGKNVWLGAGVIVLRGTTIGDNCVIGAGTVVKGNIPSNSLVTSGREMIIVPLEKR